MVSTYSIDSSEQLIAQLRLELHQAQERARVAEEQLVRVHAAVRAFKQRQVAAQQSAAKAVFDSQGEPQSTGIMKAWPANDPSLDERFERFLEGSKDHDTSRQWMLDER